MIVCSLPRCGATKFCIDLESKLQLKFIGELHPVHLNNTRKADVHETHYQPLLTPELFADILNNNDDYIVLVNQHSYLLLPQASYVVLRRDMKQAALSLANFLIKMYPGIKPAGIIHQLELMRHDYTAIMAYIDKYPKDVIWYEDYYGLYETQTPLLDEYKAKDLILKEIGRHYGPHI